MGKRKPLADGDQLLLDLQELRERQRALTRLREKEEALRTELNGAELKVKDLKRRILENTWDQKNLCSLVTQRMGRLLDSAQGDEKEENP